MKRKKYYLFILLGIFLSVAIVMKWRSQSGAAEQNGIWVLASKVKEAKLPMEIRVIGTLVARNVEVTSEVAGHVKQILFNDGSFVHVGTPLIQLDDSIYKAQDDSARAKLIYSENNYKRMVLLGKQGAIAKQAIDQSEADLKERKAEAAQASVMVKKMQLIAPFDGMVGKCKVNLGDYVTVGQPLVSLTDTKHLHVEYNVPENLISRLKLGQEVKITTAAYGKQNFIGKVAFISPTINIENRSLAIYAEVPNDNNLLASGMFVNVVQSLGEAESSLLIPARSLVPALEGEQVFKVVDGKAYSVNVTIGRRVGDNVQILQGLTANDIVITDGQLKVKNGLAVNISKQA